MGRGYLSAADFFMRTEGPFFGARLSPVPHAWMGRFRNRNRSPLVRASVDPCGRTRGIRAWCFHVILPAAKFVIAEGMAEGQTVVPDSFPDVDIDVGTTFAVIRHVQAVHHSTADFAACAAACMRKLSHTSDAECKASGYEESMHSEG